MSIPTKLVSNHSKNMKSTTEKSKFETELLTEKKKSIDARFVKNNSLPLDTVVKVSSNLLNKPKKKKEKTPKIDNLSTSENEFIFNVNLKKDKKKYLNAKEMENNTTLLETNVSIEGIEPTSEKDNTPTLEKNTLINDNLKPLKRKNKKCLDALEVQNNTQTLLDSDISKVESIATSDRVSSSINSENYSISNDNVITKKRKKVEKSVNAGEGDNTQNVDDGDKNVFPSFLTTNDSRKENTFGAKVNSTLDNEPSNNSNVNPQKKKARFRQRKSYKKNAQKNVKTEENENNTKKASERNDEDALKEEKDIAQELATDDLGGFQVIGNLEFEKKKKVNNFYLLLP